MSMALKEKAGQSGLVLSDEKWNNNDLPSLEGGWRWRHASVVLNHPAKDKDINNINNSKQTVVVLGGIKQGWIFTNSVLVLNLTESNKKWREGTPMNKGREGPTAVVCNGGVYVMGGDNGAHLDCMERIDVNDLLQSSSTASSTHESNWTTLNCRLSTARGACSAVAVHNRYIVVMGGYHRSLDSSLSSVEIVDTNHHTVIPGPSMAVPRVWFASAVIGHRIFVVGGKNGYDELDSVEYLELTTHCDNDETTKETTSAVSSFSSTWIIHSDLVLSNPQAYCAAVALGSCLIIASGGLFRGTVQVLDTHRNCVWNLPAFGKGREVRSMVTFANQVAVIGGNPDPTCATLPLMDKNTWCFCRLCEQPWNERYHSLEGSGSQDVIVTGSMRTDNERPCMTSTLPRKRALPNTP